jgi:hypothetical protein
VGVGVGVGVGDGIAVWLDPAVPLADPEVGPDGVLSVALPFSPQLQSVSAALRHSTPTVAGLLMHCLAMGLLLLPTRAPGPPGRLLNTNDAGTITIEGAPPAHGGRC